MAPARLYLKDGVTPANAADRLWECIRDGRNVGSQAAGANRVLKLRDLYLQWVETTELQLAGLTHDQLIVTMLQSTRYWHIRTIDDQTPRPWPLVDAEIAMQTSTLERLRDDLLERADRLSAAPGHIAVLDTNVLLHYLPPAEIPWPKLLGRDQVRLVVPLRVVEELDGKKYAARRDLADRARRLLPLIEKVIGPGGQPGTLGQGVSIEVPIDSGSRRGDVDADEEVLDTCRELRQLTGRSVTIVTGDTAMRLRAQARGIAVVKLPDAYRRQSARAT